MPSSHLLGVLLALFSAIIWGIGDFAGGYAARRSSLFYVLAMASLSGLLLLVPFAIAMREPLPSIGSLAWSCSAGASGTVGLAALYRALSIGNAATVAPTAAVVGATVPVLFGAVLEGIPSSVQFAGFLVGIAGIWLVSGSLPGVVTEARRGLRLAVLAGIGIGGFFVLIAQVQPGLVLTPLVASKAVSLSAALLFLLASRATIRSLANSPLALLAGVLDAGGSVLYLLAKQYTRFDIAAVLSSMFPATTVILARLVLRERVSATQLLGIAICLCGVALLAL